MAKRYIKPKDRSEAYARAGVLYGRGEATLDDLMAMRAVELREMLRLCMPLDRALRPVGLSTKRDMAEWLIERMPEPVESEGYRVRFGEPGPRGAVETFHRADAAVKGRPLVAGDRAVREVRDGG